MKTMNEGFFSKRVWVVMLVGFIGILPLLFSGCTQWEQSYLQLDPRYEGVFQKRYLLNEEVPLFASEYTILSGNGIPQMKAKQNPFSVKNWYRLLDMEGREQLRIHEKFINVAQNYKIFRGDDLVATVKQHGFFKIWYSVEIAGKAGFKITSSYDSHRFRFIRDNAVFALLSGRYAPNDNAYCLDVAPGEDDALLLATVLIIDNANPDIRRESQSDEEDNVISNHCNSAHESHKAIHEAHVSGGDVAQALHDAAHNEAQR